MAVSDVGKSAFVDYGVVKDMIVWEFLAICTGNFGLDCDKSGIRQVGARRDGI